MNTSVDRSGYNLSHNAPPLFADHTAAPPAHHMPHHDVTAATSLQQQHHARSVSGYSMPSNQPLVALHNMADGMKSTTSRDVTTGALSSSSPHFHSQNGALSVNNTSGAGGGSGVGTFDSLKGLTTSSSSLMAAGTPHGISDILRASMAGLSPLAGLNSNMHLANYLNSSARYPKPIADLPARSPMYWSGGMLNPAWRGSQGG